MALQQSKRTLMQLMAWREQIDRQVAAQQKQVGGCSAIGRCSRAPSTGQPLPRAEAKSFACAAYTQAADTGCWRVVCLLLPLMWALRRHARARRLTAWSLR